jgi:hypothetical protein
MDNGQPSSNEELKGEPSSWACREFMRADVPSGENCGRRGRDVVAGCPETSLGKMGTPSILGPWRSREICEEAAAPSMVCDLSLLHRTWPSAGQLQTWLSTTPNATTSYQLAVKLAAIDLNVLAGYVKTTGLVYAGALLQYASTYGITGLTSGFINVQNLMNAANAILGIDSRAVSGNPNQACKAPSALTRAAHSVHLFSR